VADAGRYTAAVAGSIRRPRSTRLLRRGFFQVHLWLGLGAGLYLLLIGVTGAAVVFRQDLQRAWYPEFFAPVRPAVPLAAPEVVFRELRARYPDGRLSGIDWPTPRRDSFLAYVSAGERFRTVFVHPVSGRVLGELPYDWIRWLQDLHFDLLAGPVGRIVNATGGICLAAMSVTGFVLWWPGARRWHDALRVHAGRGWNRLIWELHGATGCWSLLALLMWAATGAYFGFPQQIRRVVHAVAPLTIVDAPQSHPAVHAGSQRPLSPDTIVERARRHAPAARMARMVWPSTDGAPFLVIMARATHGDYDTSDELSLWLDQYSGEPLGVRDHGERSAGDTLIAWILPLHAGSFGGLPIRILWSALGLALPLLFATGVVMWSNRR
jgi:uncharacterized iron-regulated membrane protein